MRPAVKIGGLVSSGFGRHKLRPGTRLGLAMQITVNGEARETNAQKVAALIAELGLDPRKVAVEKNLEIVPRSLHADTAIADGDRIEIVQFVGGG
jgi:sulfur carrier protein